MAGFNENRCMPKQNKFWLMNAEWVFSLTNNRVYQIPVLLKKKKELKGTVRVISSDLPFIDRGMSDLQRYPLNLCLIKDFLFI